MQQRLPPQQLQEPQESKAVCRVSRAPLDLDIRALVVHVVVCNDQSRAAPVIKNWYLLVLGLGGRAEAAAGEEATGGAEAAVPQGAGGLSEQVS